MLRERGTKAASRAGAPGRWGRPGRPAPAAPRCPARQRRPPLHRRPRPRRRRPAAGRPPPRRLAADAAQRSLAGARAQAGSGTATSCCGADWVDWEQPRRPPGRCQARATLHGRHGRAAGQPPRRRSLPSSAQQRAWAASPTRRPGRRACQRVPLPRLGGAVGRVLLLLTLAVPLARQRAPAARRKHFSSSLVARLAGGSARVRSVRQRDCCHMRSNTRPLIPPFQQACQQGGVSFQRASLLCGRGSRLRCPPLQPQAQRARPRAPGGERLAAPALVILVAVGVLRVCAQQPRALARRLPRALVLALQRLAHVPAAAGPVAQPQRPARAAAAARRLLPHAAAHSVRVSAGCRLMACCTVRAVLCCRERARQPSGEQSAAQHRHLRRASQGAAQGVRSDSTAERSDTVRREQSAVMPQRLTLAAAGAEEQGMRAPGAGPAQAPVAPYEGRCCAPAQPPALGMRRAGAGVEQPRSARCSRAGFYRQGGACGGRARRAGQRAGTRRPSRKAAPLRQTQLRRVQAAGIWQPPHRGVSSAARCSGAPHDRGAARSDRLAAAAHGTAGRAGACRS